MCFVWHRKVYSLPTFRSHITHLNHNGFAIIMAMVSTGIGIKSLALGEIGNRKAKIDNSSSSPIYQVAKMGSHFRRIV